MPTVKPYPIDVTWYNENGKHKYHDVVFVDVYAFDDAFKQQIVDRQDALVDGWQKGDYYIVARNAEAHADYDHSDPFVDSLYMPRTFKDIQKGGTPPASTYRPL